MSEFSIATFLSSTVVAGLIAAVVSMRNNDTQVKSSNVLQERTKWREKIRNLLIELQSAQRLSDLKKLKTIQAEFITRLNPDSKNDEEIIECIQRIIENPKDKSLFNEFAYRIALLLKHDWERAKHEAAPLDFNHPDPRRKSFEEFKIGKSANHLINRTENTSAQN
ncbi:hypothetical protein MJO47_05380 [Desulfuromonas sp. KJ2020]|uniref:hypothetical protein n=1 Tax=Desulfuromonas sp. KJ2020 TaxID=2919173 RepID=UPI0020A70A33|nr:hypothetical protein [Desulfuromonas sp. KJ2020]MCP3176528.1 hypothetical protein [Desulfuromonas sp. KJ2020]